MKSGPGAALRLLDLQARGGIARDVEASKDALRAGLRLSLPHLLQRPMETATTQASVQKLARRAGAELRPADDPLLCFQGT